jgi:hypothetical protein
MGFASIQRLSFFCGFLAEPPAAGQQFFTGGSRRKLHVFGKPIRAAIWRKYP